MKKVLKVMVLLVILVFGLQLCVHADMGAPMIKPYKAKIINPDGVICRDNKGNVIATLEYGDEIEISYEATWGKEPYASFQVEADKYILADVSLKDIAPVEEIHVSKDLNVDKPLNRVVVAEEGVALYKGPSNAYEKMEVVIPRGTEIVVYAEEESGENPWFYTTYEGTSGWVCELDALGTYSESQRIYVDETELMEVVTDNETPEKLETIPAKTIVKNYIILDPWRQSYYIKYNGKWGSIYNRDGLWEADEIKICTLEEELKIYEDFMDAYEDSYPDESDINEKSEPIGTIPVNSKIAIKYEDYIGEVAYISYNGVQGWISTPYYDNVEYVKTTDLELPSFEDFTVIESPKIPVEEVKENTDNETEEVDDSEEIAESQTLIIGDVVTPNGVVPGDKYNREGARASEIIIKQIITFGVVGAIVIALTCIVTIVLINKTSKKNNKKEEVKDENKEDK